MNDTLHECNSVYKEVTMLRIGHRGAAGHAPENTVAAIRKGIELAADLVEVDVRRTRDGELVVMHDKRVDRTTNGTGDVARMTLPELRRLDAGGGERIPTVAEVLEAADGRTGLMLEMKSQDIANQLYALVRETRFRGPVLYASFLHAELLSIRRADGEAQTLALLEAVPVQAAAFAKDARASHVGLGVGTLTPEFVRALQLDGLKVFVYTVNDPRDIGWVTSLNVDGVISDFPERI